MRTVSYERSVQEQMNDMARKIGTLKGDLTVIRAMLNATLPKIDDVWVRACLDDCIDRIDRALEERT